MPMTIVVTLDVAPRFRGFLTSCMLEIAPGVYTAPRMSKGVRSRVWEVLQGWHDELDTGRIVMTWPDSGHPGGQAVQFLGTPIRDLHDADGIFLARRDYTPEPIRQTDTD